MFFTEDDLRAIITWAVWRTSRSLGIIGDEDLVPHDAVQMISASKGHRDALQELADAYSAWYEFHLQIFKAEKTGNLSTAETAQLIQLIDRREAAKQALLAITTV